MEIRDMHIIYRQANGNRHEARTLYHERFSLHSLRSHRILTRKMWETGSFVTSEKSMGRPLNIRTQESEEIAFDRFEASLSKSSVAVPVYSGICLSTVWCVLHVKGAQHLKM